MDPVRSAVDDERFRFARDVHDILGPSLTTIRVKAELASKLLDVDLERARTELHELEDLSRTAMAQVHEAVQGYREIDLAEELQRARNALVAAGVEAELPAAEPGGVADDLREIFAWAVREGVTNVIRHSRAKRCTVVLTPDRVEVRDDGHSADQQPSSDGGFGLLGLRERAADVGATVVTRTLDPGFSLQVVRG